MMTLDVKTLKAISPYLSTALILLGFLKLIIFYNIFNLTINEYLEFGEILTLSFPDIIMSGLFLFIILFISFLFRSKEDYILVSNLHEQILEGTTFIKRLIAYYLLFKEIIWMSIIVIIYSFVKADIFPRNIILFSMPAMLIIFILFFEYQYKFEYHYAKRFNSSYANLIGIFIMLIYMLSTILYFDYSSVINNHKEVSFKYFDKQVISNEKLVYVGQTKNYLFLYDIDDNLSKVFNRNDIKNFWIRKNIVNDENKTTLPNT